MSYRTVYARAVRRGRQPLHIAVYDTTEPGNKRKIRLDKTLCNVFAQPYPETGAQGELTAATCRKCAAKYRKLAKT